MKQLLIPLLLLLTISSYSQERWLGLKYNFIKGVLPAEHQVKLVGESISETDRTLTYNYLESSKYLKLFFDSNNICKRIEFLSKEDKYYTDSKYYENYLTKEGYHREKSTKIWYGRLYDGRLEFRITITQPEIYDTKVIFEMI